MYVCIKIIYLLWVVYLKSVENVITLGKLIGLLFLFCLPLLSILFLKTNLARPVMGTIFLVITLLGDSRSGVYHNRSSMFGMNFNSTNFAREFLLAKVKSQHINHTKLLLTIKWAWSHAFTKQL